MRRSRGMMRCLAEWRTNGPPARNRDVICQATMDKRFSRSEIHRSSSDSFEQLIKRVHQLLAESEAEVTWNDRIQDPDNPARLRQIDVTIRQNGVLTLVECRQHKSPQDV